MIDINKIGICIASVNNKCLPVLIESIKQYVNIDIDIFLCVNDYINHNLKHKVKQIPNIYNSFGDAYNRIVHEAFKHKDYVIICNDDIVFNPDTINDILFNVSLIINNNKMNTLGYLACRTNYSAGLQNIRVNQNSEFLGDKYANEYYVQIVDKISPICAFIQKKAWTDFKSINYFSDDIQCAEIIKNGFENYVGTFYVHHVGSQSLENQKTEIKKALDWLKSNDINNYNIYKDCY